MTNTFVSLFLPVAFAFLAAPAVSLALTGDEGGNPRLPIAEAIECQYGQPGSESTLTLFGPDGVDLREPSASGYSQTGPMNEIPLRFSKDGEPGLFKVTDLFKSIDNKWILSMRSPFSISDITIRSFINPKGEEVVAGTWMTDTGPLALTCRFL